MLISGLENDQQFIDRFDCCFFLSFVLPLRHLQGSAVSVLAVTRTIRLQQRVARFNAQVKSGIVFRFPRLRLALIERSDSKNE